MNEVFRHQVQQALGTFSHDADTLVSANEVLHATAKFSSGHRGFVDEDGRA